MKTLMLPSFLSAGSAMFPRRFLSGRLYARICPRAEPPDLGSNPVQAQTLVLDGPDRGDHHQFLQDRDQSGVLAGAFNGIAERLIAPNPSEFLIRGGETRLIPCP